MANLRTLVRRRLLEDMLDKVPGDWKILVVDNGAMSLLSAACRNQDVLNHHVTLIEDLAKKREPLPSNPCIYFIAPTEASAASVMNDWQHQQYQSAHIFFTSHAEANIIQMIAHSNVRPFLKTLMEINLDFLCVESMVYHLNLEHDLNLLYGPLRARHNPMTRIADQIVTLCSTLNEMPIIRHQNSELAQQLAREVSKRLEVFSTLNPNFKPGNENRSTLVICDRTIDLAAPLLHEFSYQAMTQDLLQGHKNFNFNRFCYEVENNAGQKVEKVAILDDLDDLFMKYRHRHIADVCEEVPKMLKDYVEKHGDSAKLSKERDLNKVQSVLRTMPQFQEQIGRMSLHVSLAEILMAERRLQSLREAAILEQNLATGERTGEKAGPLDKKETLKEIQEAMKNPNFSTKVKLRILLLLLSTQSVDPVNRNDLTTLAKLPTLEQDAVSNLCSNILPVVKSGQPVQQKKRGFFSKKPKRLGRSKEDGFEESRYIPILKTVMEDAAANSLSQTDFPHVTEPASSEAASSSAASGGRNLRATAKGGAKRPFLRGGAGASAQQSGGDHGRIDPDLEGVRMDGPRTIIFVAGGVTYSELRSAYEVMKESKVPIVIGGTSIITPNDYVNSLISMTTPELTPY